MLIATMTLTKERGVDGGEGHRRHVNHIRVAQPTKAQEKPDAARGGHEGHTDPDSMPTCPAAEQADRVFGTLRRRCPELQAGELGRTGSNLILIRFDQDACRLSTSISIPDGARRGFRTGVEPMRSW